MTFIDSHHHLWDTNCLKYSLFDEVPALNRPYPVAEYEAIAARHGVEASVCVEAASAGADGWMETMWLLGQAKRCHTVKRIVAWAPIGDTNRQEYFDRLTNINDGTIVGIRRSFESEPPDFPQRDEVIAGVKLAAQHGYSFDLVLFSPSLPATIALVRACPETQFILDHLGKPRVREEVLEPWREQIAQLAGFSNIVCKISGLSTEADHQHWSIDDLQPYIHHVIACFGWDRILFGSDWPVCDLAGGYLKWLRALQETIASAHETQKRKLFSENARRVYRFDR